jgi:hypothetical protein
MMKKTGNRLRDSGTESGVDPSGHGYRKSIDDGHHNYHGQYRVARLPGAPFHKSHRE